MEEAKADHKEEQKREEALIERAKLLGIEYGAGLQVYRDIFSSLDKKQLHKLDREGIKPLIKCLPLVHAAMQVRAHESSIRELNSINSSDFIKNSESASYQHSTSLSEATGMTRSDIDNLVMVVDENYNGFVDFAEFLLVLEFMKRVDSDPETLQQFRRAYKHAKPGTVEVESSVVAFQAAEEAQLRAPTVKVKGDVPIGATKASVAAMEAKVAQLREHIQVQALALARPEDVAGTEKEEDIVRTAQALRLKCEVAMFELVCEQMTKLAKVASSQSPAPVNDTSLLLEKNARYTQTVQ